MSDSCRPRYIFVENVPGFETSQSRAYLVGTLHTLGFHIEEYLLSPIYLGIPNDRKRYYLLARKNIASLANITFRNDQDELQVFPIIKTSLDRRDPAESVSTLREFLYQTGPVCDDVIEQDLYVPDPYLLKPIGFRFGKSCPTSEVDVLEFQVNDR
jgi:tRNA (cytosine38-C5)-methyltransferase